MPDLIRHPEIACHW